MPTKKIEKIIISAIKEKYGSTNALEEKIKVEKPRVEKFGDYSTNIAMLLAGKLGKEPMEIASELSMELSKNSIFSKVETIKPGFINFSLSQNYIIKELKSISNGKNPFFSKKNKKQVNIEFISANPTGPLTIGNGRGGFWGDVLANILERRGYKVTREYYLNDYGEQIRKLGHSILGDGEAAYRGDYIKDMRRKIKTENKNVDLIGKKAADIIFKDKIKPMIKKMGIKFDVWFRESSLHKGATESALNILSKKGLVYKKDGAIWFKSLLFGDDKDRVLVRKNGEETYFLADIAYLINKKNRKFDKMFYLWGADHYGYVSRMKGAVNALGYKEDEFVFIIFQLVELVSKGKKVKMSKRIGNYITIEELIDAVGLDVARYFFLTKSPGVHLNFDLDLAKEKSEKNPVYYIQYAYARSIGIMEKAKKGKIKPKPPNSINSNPSLKLAKEIILFPDILDELSSSYQLQKLPSYALSLAKTFHHFYTEERVISPDKKKSQENLFLVEVFSKTIKEVLLTMGMSTPKNM